MNMTRYRVTVFIAGKWARVGQHEYASRDLAQQLFQIWQNTDHMVRLYAIAANGDETLVREAP